MKKIVKKIIGTNAVTLENLFSRGGCVYTFLNPVSYLQARPHKEWINKFDGIFADGSGLTLFIRLFYGKSVQRRSFDMTSLAPKLFGYASENAKTLYFVGAKPGVLEQTIHVLKGMYPSLKISGFHHGYFKSEQQRNQVVDEIISLNPDYVIVGMGAIIQDQFLLYLKEKGFKGVGFSCGGYFHQVAQNGAMQYYPPWVQKTGLRFLYRMIHESHTRKRYLQAIFLFPIFFLIDRIH